MRYSAELAWRSPPRLSRWRVVLPEDACWGLTPQRAAKEASLRSRSGLSPAVMSRAAAVSGPMPRWVSNVGVWRGGGLGGGWFLWGVFPVRAPVGRGSERQG